MVHRDTEPVGRSSPFLVRFLGVPLFTRTVIQKECCSGRCRAEKSARITGAKSSRRYLSIIFQPAFDLDRLSKLPCTK